MANIPIHLFEHPIPRAVALNFVEWGYGLFSKLGETGKFYRHPLTDIMVYLGYDDRPFYLKTPMELAGTINSVVAFFSEGREAAPGRGRPRINNHLTEDLARHLFGGPFRGVLPPLLAMLNSPVVVAIPGTPPYISKEGYDPAAQLYYAPHNDKPLVPDRPSTKWLGKCFSGVPFQRTDGVGASSPYLANLVAWMVRSVVFSPVLPTADDVQNPLLVVTGNQPGIGKTALVKTVGKILNGHPPVVCDPSPSELHKQIATRFMSNDRFIFLDNIRSGPHGFDSTALAAFLTTGNISVRLLNTNQQVSEANALFALTINDAKLSPDIATRSLPVRLYADEPKPMVPYCYDFASQHRAELYGELLALACQTPARAPYNPVTRFVQWETFVAPRVLPFLGPLKIDAQSFDKRLQEIFEYGLDLGGRGGSAEFMADDLLRECLNAPTRYPQLSEWLLGAVGKKGQTTRLGIYLAQNCGARQAVSAKRFCELKKAGKKYFIYEEGTE